MIERHRMPEPTLLVRFWGVRGSIPTAERDTWRYGGNTPCVEIVSPGGTRIILDCGTGVRLLGKRLLAEPTASVEAHVLVTHYHWDHIQGIPFFQPLFSPRSHLWFYSFRSQELGPDSLRKVLEAQVTQPYFPVHLNDLPAQREFMEIDGGAEFRIADVRVRTCWLNHPQKCLGFRLECSAGTVVYATDNEPGDEAFDTALREFASNADLLIADAQYSPKELSVRHGWGHSTWRDAARLARDSHVSNLALFHHDPNSTDSVVDSYLRSAREEFPAAWAAMEGMAFSVSPGQTEARIRPARIGQRRNVKMSVVISGCTEDGRAFREQSEIRNVSIHGAYMVLSHRPRLQSEIEMILEGVDEITGKPFAPLKGTVVHHRAAQDGNAHGIGVAFVEESREAKTVSIPAAGDKTAPRK